MRADCRPGRVLGLDLGDARIGVAISDADRVAVPSARSTPGPPAELKAIAALVREHDVALVVIGLPLSMEGSAARGRPGSRVRRRGPRDLTVPVVLQDERLSTVAADRGLRDAGASGSGSER